MKKPGTTTRRNGTIRLMYTQSEEGLEQEFNSLQAQREACEAFINSQRHEGWVCLRAAYDDGGFSGATMERPALQQPADLPAGRVNTIVVYKIDRLTRSLTDFAKIVEILDARGASFMSVTPAVQHDDLDGTLDPQCPVIFRAVRARGHRRAHPRQDRRIEKKRDVDGRGTAAWVWGRARRLFTIVESEAETMAPSFFAATPNSARSGC